jgi:hypothetical protein
MCLMALQKNYLFLEICCAQNVKGKVQKVEQLEGVLDARARV